MLEVNISINMHTYTKPTPFQEGFSHSELLGKHRPFTGSSLKMGKVVKGICWRKREVFLSITFL